MVQIVGYNESEKKRVTCSSGPYRVGCGAILTYTKSDVQSYSGRDYSGGSDGREWIVCPGCGSDITLRSW